MARIIRFSKGEYGLFAAIGLTAGQVTFGSLFLQPFSLDKNSFFLIIFSSVLTVLLWGASWFLTRRFKL